VAGGRLFRWLDQLESWSAGKNARKIGRPTSGFDLCLENPGWKQYAVLSRMGLRPTNGHENRPDSFGRTSAGNRLPYTGAPLAVRLLRYLSMNPDQQLIQSAYDDAVKKLYAALFDNYVSAGGDTAMIQDADRHFSTGVALARSSRERAIALLA